MKWLIISLAMVIAAQGLACANDKFRASTLYAACAHVVKGSRQDSEFLEQSCTSYLRGLTDGLYVMQSLRSVGTRTCMPKNEPIGVPEAREIFEKYLVNDPSSVADSAGLAASFAPLDV